MEDVPHAEVPLKVLVVDDQADSADAVAFMLSLMGHDVHTAYGPREALDKFRQVRPTVVFMDISMPELSGLEAAVGFMAEAGQRDDGRGRPFRHRSSPGEAGFADGATSAVERHPPDLRAT